MIKAIIFDIDGTLTRDIAWVKVTNELGASIEHNDNIFASWKRGELSEIEAKKKLIENWSRAGKCFKKDWEDILKQIPVREDAKETIKYLKDKGYRISMITGSFDLYAQIIGEKLEIDNWYANTKLIWDKNGKLSDVETVIDDKALKIEHFNHYCSSNNLQFDECVPVGDSENDLGLFEITKNGIAVKTEFEAKELEKIAWKKVNNLIELKDII